MPGLEADVRDVDALAQPVDQSRHQGQHDIDQRGVVDSAAVLSHQSLEGGKARWLD